MTGGALAAFGVTTLAPLVIGLVWIWSLDVFSMAGELLQASDGLGPEVFGPASRLSLVVLAVAFLIRVGSSIVKVVWSLKGSKAPLVARLLSWSAWAVFVLLGGGSVFLASHGRDFWSQVGQVPVATFWIATLLAFALWLPLELLGLGFRTLRFVYRVASRGRFRAGFATAGSTILVAAFWLVLVPLGRVQAEHQPIGDFVLEILNDEAGKPDENAFFEHWLERVSTWNESAYDRPKVANLALRSLPLTDDSAGEYVRDCMTHLTSPERFQGDNRRPSVKAMERLTRDFRLSKEDAEDIVHTKIVDVCIYCSSTPCLNVAAMLMDAVRRMAIDEKRRSARFTTCEPGDDLVGGACWNPVAAVERAENAKLLHQAFCRLSEQQQQIIELRVWNELSHAEIAAQTGTTETQAKDAYNNAVKKLRKHLKDRQCN